jgi:hypothetical protein
MDNRYNLNQQMQGISTKIDVQAQAAAEREKIPFPPLPALHSEAAVMRFLDRLDLLPRGISASAASQEGVIDRLIASGFKLNVYDLDQALARTTLNSFGRMFVKARLGELALI